jgi:hypothetical protein
VGDVGGEVIGEGAAALAGLVVGDQDTQARAGALGDLAELLRRPPEARTELLAVHVERHLAGEYESLVGGQLVGELAQAAHVLTTGQSPGHVGGRIDKGSDWRLLLSSVLVGGLAQGFVGRDLDRTASAQGALAITDTREEALLQGVGDVRLADKGPRRACGRA